MQQNTTGQPYFQGPQLPQPAPQPVSASHIKARRALGLIVGLSISLVLLISSLGFGFWAFSSRQDYKNNSDKKVSAAVKTAQDDQSKKDEADFAEREKWPTKNYTSPSTAGTISITYPK